MSQVGKKLREIRERLNLTQQEFYKEIGIDQRKASYWETKAKSLPADAVHKISRTYKIPEEEFFGVAEPPASGFKVPTGTPEDIPLVGRGRGGRGAFNVDGYPVGEGRKRIRRPYDVSDPNAFAVEVEGSSMAPRYEQGDVVVCSPAKGWSSGQYCVVITNDDEVLVKKVKDNGDTVILSSLAPGYDPIVMHKKDIRKIHKIVWRKE